MHDQLTVNLKHKSAALKPEDEPISVYFIYVLLTFKGKQHDRPYKEVESGQIWPSC